MLRKHLLSFSFLFLLTSFVVAQTGALKVTLTDEATKETIPFGAVIVETGGVQVAAGQTDIDGNVIIKPLNPGRYDVKGVIVGYTAKQATGVVVTADKTSYVELKMKSGIDLGVVEKVEYVVPLIDPDTKSGATVTREQFQNMATKNINSVASTTAGITQSDEGSALNIRGARAEGTAYYVDGQKVIGSAGVPQQSIEQITTIIGGTPAQYGDALGGVIAITTRGPQSHYFGGLELVSSQITDAYGFNQGSFSAGGPLLVKKDSLGNKKPVLDFILSGEAIYDKDPNPSAIGSWKLNSDKLAELEKSPLSFRTDNNGLITAYRKADYLLASNFEKIKAREYNDALNFKISPKFNYQPTDNLTLTLGGFLNYSRVHGNSLQGTVFAGKNTPLTSQLTYNVYGRVTQKFGTQAPKSDEKSSANIKNAYYSIQGGYQRFDRVSESEKHEDNFFNYGYVGKFDRYKSPFYAQGGKDTFYAVTVPIDTLISFTPSDLNPELAAYTKSVFDYYSSQGIKIRNDATYQTRQGLSNGDGPNPVNSIFSNTGTPAGYAKASSAQFRVFGTFNADIKNHAIQVGFEYEQRTERFYSVSASRLWSLARLLVNKHLSQLDTVPYTLNTQLSGGGKVYYDRPVMPNDSSAQFDRSLREKLGKPANGVEYLNVDAYDPSFLSINMFSADELLNNGNALVAYYGYDAYGNETNNSSFDAFFSDRDSKGNLKRYIDAYRPIYMAGFIQDKFDFKDLKFNIGLRIDRFDANQKVLKDKYIVGDFETASEVTKLGNGNSVSHPSNIGSDFVVYGNDKTNPTSITGYRNGETWYDKNGKEIEDGKAIYQASGSAMYPFLKSTGVSNLPKAFTDYTPQVIFMPRIAFAFPISDQANFFAHYDILTQRPTGGNILNPTDYIYLGNNTGGFLSNPNLKPQQTTDYELGFRQVLNERKNSALEITAFYKELRDMIQQRYISYAYPASYTTYDNIDFGTVKGLSVTYDFRRTNGVEFKASYTLSFADGTGSNANSGGNLASAGVGNLRTPTPLSYDQRHGIVVVFDYRFGNGADYRGPSQNWIRKVLEDFGAGIIFRANSGTPYTAESGYASGLLGTYVKKGLKGSINGSNLPWTYRVDLRVDKNIAIKWGKDEKGEAKHKSLLNVYVQVLNLFDTQNILGVFSNTGSASDNGYLSSPFGQSYLATGAPADHQQAFIDQYNIGVNNQSGFYSIPRRIRIGVIMNF